ncbi:MAG TPA: TetR/AcrR family transcriptional regulator [Solirubrobacterales bacterium]
MEQNQRDRLIAALTKCLYEDGYGKTTVGGIGKQAHISKSVFYELFDDKYQCFIAAYDSAVERMREVVQLACGGSKDWASGVCAGLSALLAHMAEEPAAASLVLVEGLHAGRDLHERFQAAVESFVPYLREGAPVGVGGGSRPEATDEAVVGGIASMLGRHVLAGEVERLNEFFPEIAEFALTPYLGADEARRIISTA